MSNINQVVSNDKNLTTFKRGVIASGLDKVLSGTEPYTVFAPSDLAFRKLNKEILENLLKPENKAKLTDVWNYHIVVGRLNFNDLKDGEKLKTVSGKELLVQVKNGDVSIEGARIERRDVQTSNGIIHSLDTVMMKN